MEPVELTPEEIAAAPLLMNPQVKEIKPETRSRLNIILCIILVVNTVLQFIALVTPGWNIVEGDVVSTYDSVYYTIMCVDKTPLENVSTTSCSSTTFQGDFAVKYNDATDSLKPALASAYNLKVRHQMNIQLSWFIIVGSTVFQIFRYFKRYKAYPRLTAINAMVLICACCAMYQALYEAFVHIDMSNRQAEYVAIKVKFPYSVLLYAFAFVQTFACTVVVLKQIYDYICHIKHALFETKVQVETLEKQLESQFEDFQHYREFFYDRNQLRGRSRKSHGSDRRSQRGDSLASLRYSERRKENMESEKRNSENVNDNRNQDIQESQDDHMTTGNEIERQTHELDILAQSGVSLDNLSVKNHKDARRNRFSREFSETTNNRQPNGAHKPKDDVPESQFIEEMGQSPHPSVSTPAKDIPRRPPRRPSDRRLSKPRSIEQNPQRKKSSADSDLDDSNPFKEDVELKE